MIRVRLMREEDIWDVSTVRVRGWQAAYPGMVPQDYLDALTVAEDARMRRDMFASSMGSVVNLVAEEDGAVVGWAALGPSKEADRKPQDGELLALYAALTASAPASERRCCGRYKSLPESARFTGSCYG